LTAAVHPGPKNIACQKFMARREVRRAFLAFHDFLAFIVDFVVAIDPCRPI